MATTCRDCSRFRGHRKSCNGCSSSANTLSLKCNEFILASVKTRRARQKALKAKRTKSKKAAKKKVVALPKTREGHFKALNAATKSVMNYLTEYLKSHSWEVMGERNSFIDNRFRHSNPPWGHRRPRRIVTTESKKRPGVKVKLQADMQDGSNGVCKYFVTAVVTIGSHSIRMPYEVGRVKRPLAQTISRHLGYSIPSFEGVISDITTIREAAKITGRTVSVSGVKPRQAAVDLKKPVAGRPFRIHLRQGYPARITSIPDPYVRSTVSFGTIGLKGDDAVRRLSVKLTNLAIKTCSGNLTKKTTALQKRITALESQIKTAKRKIKETQKKHNIPRELITMLHDLGGALPKEDTDGFAIAVPEGNHTRFLELD